MPARRRRRRVRSSSPWAFVLAAAGAAVLVALVMWPAPRRPQVARHAVPRPIASAAASAAATAATVGSPPPDDERRRDPEAAASPPAARLAIVIDDCGQWPQIERGFIALDVPLTLSVLPHVRYGEAIAREAHAAGLGVMLHVPMENLSGLDPGPGAVTTAMSDTAIEARLREDLDAVPLATGANNHEGSRASADPRVMRDVAAVLAERGRFFVDSRTTAATVAEREARAAGIPTTRRDVFLDDVDDEASVASALRRAAALARARGAAVAIGHPRTATLAALIALLPELRRDGVELVRVADLATT